MKKILVVGADGQLGSELIDISKEYTFDFTFLTINDLDITNSKSLEAAFNKKEYNYCINCAAYTAVDKAEEQKGIAQNVNATAVGSLAKLCEQNKITLIHVSTDFVFDGINHKPYIETDKPNPINVYGATKLGGEKECIQNCSDYVILRTSWVYSQFGNNFVKTIQRLCAEKDELGIIFDQIGTPTYARDLATAILDIITKIENKQVSDYTGIYHYSNEGVVSWYDFAIAIRDFSELTCNIKPIETKSYPTPAARPHYSVMNKIKVKEKFNLSIPFWRDSLRKMLS